MRWTQHGPIADRPMRHGRADGAPGVGLSQVRVAAMLEVMVRNGRHDDFRSAASTVVGAEVAAGRAVGSVDEMVLVWTGAGRWLAISSRKSEQDLQAVISNALGDRVSVSPQSDGRIVLSVGGPMVRDVLAKVSSLDYDPDVCPVGTAAATAVGHIAATIWRAPDAPDGSAAFFIATPRSTAECVWHDLLASAAEYGVAVG